jgi:hypothetical protein
MQVPVPHDVTEDESSRHTDTWKIFRALHLSSVALLYECINAYTIHVELSHSVVQIFDPSLAWNQNPLLQEQKESGAGKKNNVTV